MLLIVVTMCRYVTRSNLTSHNTGHMKCWSNARRVVRKYKKMTLRKEMRRMRQLLPGGETLKQYEVIDQTILLIQQLERKLLTRIKQGMIHPKINQVMSEHCIGNMEKLDVEMLRNIVMETRQIQ